MQLIASVASWRVKRSLKIDWNSGKALYNMYDRLYRVMQLELIVVGDFNDT